MFHLLLGGYAMPFSTTQVGADRFRAVSRDRFNNAWPHDIALDAHAIGFTGEVRVRLANDNDRGD